MGGASGGDYIWGIVSRGKFRGITTCKKGVRIHPLICEMSFHRMQERSQCMMQWV